MKNNRTLVEVIGWLGVALILLAYILTSFNALDNQSLVYQLLNLFGALGILIDTWVKKDYQPVFLNVVWALVAIVAIARL